MTVRSALFPDHPLMMTPKARSMLEYNLMCERGRNKDNSAGSLLRRIMRGKVGWAEVRLVLICALVGGGMALPVAEWLVDCPSAHEGFGKLQSLAIKLLKPLSGRAA